MPNGTFKNVEIKGICCAVPHNIKYTEEYKETFGRENIEKFIKLTGIKQRYVAIEKQTSSDLCYIAAEELIKRINWQRDTIDALIFVSQTPDYRLPATACVLHGRLGLNQKSISFDINLGCSGYVYGLTMIGSLLQIEGIRRVLLLCGDTISKCVSPKDKSTALLFGDAGSATAIERTKNSEMNFVLKTNGKGYKSIIIPSGSFRNLYSEKERKVQEEEMSRSDYDIAMNGSDVFDFTINDVPMAVKEFLDYTKLTINDFDVFVPHQANLFMLNHIIKKINLSIEKMAISIDRYGNTSVASIPLTIVDRFSRIEYNSRQTQNLLLAGFGVGLSWGIVSIILKSDVYMSIIYTNDFFQENGGSFD